MGRRADSPSHELRDLRSCQKSLIYQRISKRAVIAILHNTPPALQRRHARGPFIWMPGRTVRLELSSMTQETECFGSRVEVSCRNGIVNVCRRYRIVSFEDLEVGRRGGIASQRAGI